MSNNSNENSKKNLIIVPTYNERENIGILLKEIVETVTGTDIVVVDDDSPDGTAEEVKEFSKKLSASAVGEGSGAKIHLILRKGVRGLGTAYNTGLKYGLEKGYPVMITMDADHSHNPVHLPAILAAIEDNDVVIGSRYIRDGGTINWRIRRILLSWLANRFARFLLSLKGNDLTSGFRAYRREILEKVDLEHIRSNGYSYLVEMLFHVQRQRARVAEVPIIFFDRTLGKSKISRREIYRGAFTLLRLRLTSGAIRRNSDKKTGKEP